MKTSNKIILAGIILYVASYFMPAARIPNWSSGSSMAYGWQCAVSAIWPGVIFFGLGIPCTIANLFMIITPIYVMNNKVTEKFRRFHYHFCLLGLLGCIVAETILIGFCIWMLSMFIVNYGLWVELSAQNQANINDSKEVNVRRKITIDEQINYSNKLVSKGYLKNIDEQIALMIGVIFLIGRLVVLLGG